MVEAGKKRSVGVNIVLFIVTLGIYWFVWLYKAFAEVARQEQKPLRAGTWVLVLVVLWAGTFGLAVVGLVDIFQNLTGKGGASGTANPFSQEAIDYANALYWVGTGLTVAFFVVQLLYTLQANALVRDAAKRIGDPNQPAPLLAILFNVCYIATEVPVITGLAALGALVLAVIWIVQVQGAMNRYWDRAAVAPQTPPAGWTPPQPAPRLAPAPAPRPAAPVAGRVPSGPPPVRR